LSIGLVFHFFSHHSKYKSYIMDFLTDSVKFNPVFFPNHLNMRMIIIKIGKKNKKSNEKNQKNRM